MNSKANLKAAREAISTKNFNEAVKACNRVLLWESENYNAWVFLGVAYTGLEDDAEAEKSYRRAIEINPDQLLAWQGLVSFYEKRKRFEEMANTIQDILPKVAASGDGNRVADYLEKLIHVYENDEKNKDKYIHFLKMYLPGNPIYDLVKDTKSARQPADVLWTIVGLTEEDQARMIDSRVQSRRYNVNAGPLDQVRAEVEAEVYAESKLGEMYETLLHLAEQDGSDTRVLHLKLLEFWYKRLPGVSRKEQLCKDLLDLAQSLADQQVDASLPYEIIVEFTDAKSFDDYDTNLMNRLVEQYPETGLSKLIQGYRLYHGGHIDEAFDAFGEGLDIAPNSLFGYLCLCWIYYDSKEYETGLEYATKGRDLVRKRGKETSRLLTNMIMSMELCMAHCYRHMDTKYYPDAMGLYEKILACDANEIGALEGTGLILREEGRYDEALEHFEKVFNLEPERHIALAEIGWIYCQKGVYEKAINYISKAIESADQAIAEYYYRLGRVYWSMGDDYKSDTNYAFKYFIKAVKLDPQFPDGFTFLGHYYRSVQNDHVRAKKCYSKAYLLNPLDVDAAWHLSNYYIQDNELDEAETLFQQVTEISPKTGWAWRRLGFAKMNQDKYDEAITCFQKALRTDTSDVQCWEGLAESYAHEGRYVAALKAFGRATDLNPRSIHGNYAKALVRQKIGLLDEAVAGFRKTLKIAESQGKVDYVPALKGLADTFLEQAKEEIQLGFFGRAAETCGNVVKTCLRGLKQDIVVVGFWKLIGDACSVFRTIPTCLHLCAYTDLQETMRILLENGPSPHEQLKFPEADATVRSLETFLSLQAFDISPKEALDFIFSCATFAYKKALVLCRNHPMIAPGLWHDLALLYHWIGENGQASRPQEVADTAILCIRRAIKMEPTQYQFWNALGVISMQTSPKISQYALVKAMELNSRSAVPWTNYGFLCLAQKDYELANQAFETAHALDPEWISAWVGQAHVAALWGNEAAAIFQHAFESSNGSSLEASYGYAETVFSQLTTSDSSKDASIIISPAFALQKLTEQRLDNALALNLLGLLFERLGQFERASAAFLQAIEALDTQCKRGSLNDEEFNSRIAKVHANLGRTLCASGSFQAAIESYNRAIECGSGSLRVYCQLGAGIAYYFEEQLEESLAMFETALAETEDDTDLRLDVNVLLSQVLWALGGEEQRQVAKNQLFGSIADNPSYLPAIFSLCAMGLLENDETLANAALQELGKVPTDTVYKNDKEHWIPWLFSRYYLLQNEPRQAMRSLAKSVHQFPWMAGLWRRLASNALTLTGDSESCGAIQLSMTSAALALAAESKTESADAKAEAYELAARVYLINESDDEQQSRQKASRLAQRAAMMAPWRISAWQTLASA